MTKTYRCTLQVRGRDLDSYRHVNHSVYLTYFEEARWEMLKEEGLSLTKFDEFKCWPVVAQVEVRYLKPALLGQKLEIITTPVSRTRSSVTFEQEIRFENEPIARAKITAVMINEMQKATRLHPEMARLVPEESSEKNVEK